MPASHYSGPRPACVEDFDDDRNTVLSDTRIHARTGKDGSDSGYSSRTGTVDGEHYEHGRTADLKSGDLQIERERMPYSSGPAVRRGESISRQKPVRPVVSDQVQPPKEEKKKFCHPPGICYTCDKVGYHMTQEEVEELKGTLRRERTAAPETTKILRQLPSKQLEDRNTEPIIRRMSSHRESRPPMQYPPPAMQPMPASFSAPAGYYGAGYPAPGTPTGYATPPVYTYAAYPQTPATPVVAGYAPQPGPQEYFAQAVPEIRPPKPGRRASTYGEQDFAPLPREYEDPMMPQRSLLRSAPVVASRNESRPQAPRHASGRSIDHDRYEQDRRQMPPPERPAVRTQPLRRPSIHKSYTYADSGYGRSRAEDRSHEAAVELTGTRRPRDIRDSDHDDNRASHSVRAREETRSTAPSSYRSDAKDLAVRPPARKSVSYSNPSQVQTAAKSSTLYDTTQRRSTEPLTPMDAKVAEAEAYQANRSSIPADEMSVEQMKSIRPNKVPSRSNAGSDYSHRESHYSTSKDSTSAKKARRGSIVIETGSKNRPLSIQLPDGLTVQIGPDQEKDKETTGRQQKLLEHASTSASGVSHSSATRSRAATSSHASSDRGRDREYHEKLARRSSHINESRPPPSPVKSTANSSRAPSRSRTTSDTNGSRTRRQSVVSERVVFRS